ncbi:beta-2 adrenergic receptor-like [Ornithodoros turicata]
MVMSSPAGFSWQQLVEYQTSDTGFPGNASLGVPGLDEEFQNITLEEEVPSWPLRWFGAFVCGIVILVTLLGNILVLVVVSRFRRMRSVTNILLASLATADITVALLVMPFLVVYDIEREWHFGSIACHMWISCDVMCCTASILHLCFVALDRFWAITRPLRYRACVSKRRLGFAIAFIWLCSAAISFIPVFMGWYGDGTVSLFETSTECTLKVNGTYALISSMTSFYLPLPVMFYVYFRILLVAERQARDIKMLERSLQNGDQRVRRSIRRQSRQIIIDTKAIRTLGIVMGVFCVCWLPFFLMYLITAYCPACDIAYEYRSGITWLGYFNSAFNPCIYAFLNKEFKEAFQRVLGCRKPQERDFPTMDEHSSSRSMQRMDRLHIEPVTPDCRTPSLTPDSTTWPAGIIHTSHCYLQVKSQLAVNDGVKDAV